MNKIESFKTFSQLQSQLREEARQKELASKREASVAEFNELLSKYNASSIEDLNEEDREAFMKELTKEGNAFGAARAEAIAKGEDKFEVDGEEFDVENVDKEDEENAEEFVEEARSLNDPVAMKMRAAQSKAKKDVKKEAPVAKKMSSAKDKKLAQLKAKRAQIMKNMEQEAEMEGGPIADKYGAMLDKIDKEISKLTGKKEMGYKLTGESFSNDELLEANKRQVNAVVKRLTNAPVNFPIIKKMSDSNYLWFIKQVLKETLVNVNFHSEADMAARQIKQARYEAIEIRPAELGGNMDIAVPKSAINNMIDIMVSEISSGAKYDGYAVIEGVAQFLSTLRFGKASASSLMASLNAMLNEGMINESEIKSAEDFAEYAETVLRKAFGDEYDEEKAKEMIDGITSKVDGDFGAAVGMLTKSLGEAVELTEKKADGTISDDEDERREALMAEVESAIDQLLTKIKADAEDIGGSFRSPGIMHDAKKIIDTKLKRFK